MAIVAEDFEQVARAIDPGAQPLLVDVAGDRCRRHPARGPRGTMPKASGRIFCTCVAGPGGALGVERPVPAVRPRPSSARCRLRGYRPRASRSAPRPRPVADRRPRIWRAGRPRGRNRPWSPRRSRRRVHWCKSMPARAAPIRSEPRRPLIVGRLDEGRGIIDQPALHVLIVAPGCGCRPWSCRVPRAGSSPRRPRASSDPRSRSSPAYSRSRRRASPARSRAPRRSADWASRIVGQPFGPDARDVEAARRRRRPRPGHRRSSHSSHRSACRSGSRGCCSGSSAIAAASIFVQQRIGAGEAAGAGDRRMDDARGERAIARRAGIAARAAT